MVQSINYAAIFGTVKGIFRPHLFIPACSVPDIRWIDFAALRAAGYQAICFDKDNTLTLPYRDEIYPELHDSIKDCKKHFEKVFVVSNSAGGPDDKDNAKAKLLESSLGLSILKHKLKKPACAKEIFPHVGTNIAPAQIVFIGDRLTTDVLMANVHGMLSIHTQPLTEDGDNEAAKRVRRIENWFLNNWGPLFNRPDLQGRFVKRSLL